MVLTVPSIIWDQTCFMRGKTIVFIVLALCERTKLVETIGKSAKQTKIVFCLYVLKQDSIFRESFSLNI